MYKTTTTYTALDSTVHATAKEATLQSLRHLLDPLANKDGSGIDLQGLLQLITERPSMLDILKGLAAALPEQDDNEGEAERVALENIRQNVIIGGAHHNTLGHPLEWVTINQAATKLGLLVKEYIRLFEKEYPRADWYIPTTNFSSILIQQEQHMATKYAPPAPRRHEPRS